MFLLLAKSLMTLLLLLITYYFFCISMTSVIVTNKSLTSTFLQMILIYYVNGSLPALEVFIINNNVKSVSSFIGLSQTSSPQISTGQLHYISPSPSSKFFLGRPKKI